MSTATVDEVKSMTENLSVGDMVLFYNDPFNPQDPIMGWVCNKPGLHTIKILVWAEEAGFLERHSVRHKDDPFWKTSETAPAWGRWGCFEPHPSTKALKEVHALLTKQKLSAAKQKSQE